MVPTPHPSLSPRRPRCAARGPGALVREATLAAPEARWRSREPCRRRTEARGRAQRARVPGGATTPARRRSPTYHHRCSVGARHWKISVPSKQVDAARKLLESLRKPRCSCASPQARHRRRQAPGIRTCAGSAHRLPRARASLTQCVVSFAKCAGSFADRTGSFTKEEVSSPDRAVGLIERTVSFVTQAESFVEQPGSSVERQESFAKCSESFVKRTGSSAERAGSSACGQEAYRGKATCSLEPAGRSGCPWASAAPSSFDSLAARSSRRLNNAPRLTVEPPVVMK